MIIRPPLPTSLQSGDVFALDNRIRWTAYGDVNGKVFFSEVRPGITPAVAVSKIQDLLRLRWEYLTELNRRTELFVGPSRYIITAYKAYIEAIVMRGDRYLAITVDSDTSLNELRIIIEAVENLTF